VLTFDYSRTPVLMADVVLCPEVIAREAQDQAVSLEAHYAHLVVHGVLHAQGYDHEEDGDALQMQAQEAQVLARLGIANPYANGAC
jgi:probable rRNA maturation factor